MFRFFIMKYREILQKDKPSKSLKQRIDEDGYVELMLILFLIVGFVFMMGFQITGNPTGILISLGGIIFVVIGIVTHSFWGRKKTVESQRQAHIEKFLYPLIKALVASGYTSSDEIEWLIMECNEYMSNHGEIRLLRFLSGLSKSLILPAVAFFIGIAIEMSTPSQLAFLLPSVALALGTFLVVGYFGFLAIDRKVGEYLNIKSNLSYIRTHPKLIEEYSILLKNNSSLSIDKMVSNSLVHDNMITSSQVDFEKGQMIIETKYYGSGELSEITDIVFNDYLAHIFKNEMKGSIISNIEEYPLSLFIEHQGELLKDNWHYCWPINYKTTDVNTEFDEFMQSNDLKVYEISSSYGLHGFVIAKQMDIVVSEVSCHSSP